MESLKRSWTLFITTSLYTKISPKMTFSSMSFRNSSSNIVKSSMRAPKEEDDVSSSKGGGSFGGRCCLLFPFVGCGHYLGWAGEGTCFIGFHYLYTSQGLRGRGKGRHSLAPSRGYKVGCRSSRDVVRASRGVSQVASLGRGIKDLPLAWDILCGFARYRSSTTRFVLSSLGLFSQACGSRQGEGGSEKSSPMTISSGCSKVWALTVA